MLIKFLVRNIVNKLLQKKIMIFFGGVFVSLSTLFRPCSCQSVLLCGFITHLSIWSDVSRNILIEFNKIANIEQAALVRFVLYGKQHFMPRRTSNGPLHARICIIKWCCLKASFRVFFIFCSQGEAYRIAYIRIFKVRHHQA